MTNTTVTLVSATVGFSAEGSGFIFVFRAPSGIFAVANETSDLWSEATTEGAPTLEEWRAARTLMGGA